jgi:hypothetical protein
MLEILRRFAKVRLAQRNLRADDDDGAGGHVIRETNRYLDLRFTLDN